MTRITQIFTLSAVALALAACNSSSERVELEPVNPPTPSPDPGTAEIRIHHTSANAPAVNIFANDEILADLEGVDYQMSSPLLEVPADTYSVRVDGILPGGEFATVIDADLAFDEGYRYDIFALGTIDADDDRFAFGPFIIDREITPVADGEARLLVLHGAPVDVPVDVYVSAAGAEIDAGNPTFTISYQEYQNPSIPAGDYSVTLTVAGEPSEVLYSSPDLELPAGADLVVTATLNVGANAANRPIALLVSDAEAGSVVYSTDTGADVRVVHAIGDAPPVDVYVGEISGDPALSEFAFESFTDYINFDAGDADLFVTAAGSTDAVLEASLTLVDGWQGNVFAAGELGTGEANLQPVVLDNRRVATEARLRLIHASSFAGDVDIYVSPTDDFTAVDPAFESVPFNLEELATTGNVALDPGAYFVTITLAGTQDAALGPLPIELTEGGIYTAVAVGTDAESLGVILMDDFVDNDE